MVTLTVWMTVMKRTANPLSSTDNPATSSLVVTTKTPAFLSDGFATVCLIVPMDLMKVNEYNLQVGILILGYLQVGNLQVGNLKVGNLKVGNLKVGNLKVGNLKVGNLKVGYLQVGNLQDGNLQVRNYILLKMRVRLW